MYEAHDPLVGAHAQSSVNLPKTANKLNRPKDGRGSRGGANQLWSITALVWVELCLRVPACMCTHKITCIQEKGRVRYSSLKDINFCLPHIIREHNSFPVL